MDKRSVLFTAEPKNKYTYVVGGGGGGYFLCFIPPTPVTVVKCEF